MGALEQNPEFRVQNSWSVAWTNPDSIPIDQGLMSTLTSCIWKKALTSGGGRSTQLPTLNMSLVP